MAFQVSPGVQVKEIDATTIVPAVSTSIGGFAGAFTQGPVNTPVIISSEKELASVFGRPDDQTAKYFLTAASFLKYGSALKVVRVVGSGAEHASNTEAGTGQVITTAEDAVAINAEVFAAREVGEQGNSLKVAVFTAASATDFTTWGSTDNYESYFSAEPGTSATAVSYGASSANDELHILVIDEDGLYTGNPGEVLESWEFLSLASDAKSGDNSTLYYKNVINEKSEYIWACGGGLATEDGYQLGPTGANNNTTAFTAGAAGFEAGESLGGGASNNDSVGASEIVGTGSNGFQAFADSDLIDVNLLFSVPDADGAQTIADALITLCEVRKDCMAFVSPPIEDSTGSNPVSTVKTWVSGLPSTSYASADSTAVYVYDKYNDVYRWIGAAGYVAGLCAGTDASADAWFSPAGLNRGQLLGVTKLAINPTKAERDELYKGRVNPIVSFPGQGTVLFGDKTLLARPSAFDRINVRRLFIVLEKAIATASKFTLFELNDEFTRAQFRNLVEPFLRDVKGRRGVTDFLVVCDETNNTGQVIDSNSFVADIYVKPARSINFITLNFIATRTGVDFSEIAS